MTHMQKIRKFCGAVLITLLCAGAAHAHEGHGPEGHDHHHHHVHGGHDHSAEHAEQLTPRSTIDPAEAATKLMPAHDYSSLEGLIIQEGGRKKPLLTFARESLLTMSGRSSFEIADGVKVEPMPFIISIWLSGRDWTAQPLITVDYGPLKEALGLPVLGKRFSFQQIVGSPNFAPLYEEMEAVRADQGSEGFSELQEKLNEVSHRVALFKSLQGGAAFRVIPHPTEVTGTWVTIPEGQQFYSGEKWADLNRETIHLFAAYHGQPIDKDFAQSAADFRQLQWNLSPEVMPAAGKIRAELIYEHFHFFRWAWILCLLGTIVIGLSWMRWQRAGFMISIGLSSAALILLTIGMALRVYISGRAPVTNMYETVIWVGFGILVFALLFEARYRCRVYLASGVPLAGIFLILADSVPAILDPTIAPLTAVLRDNFWLTTHVLTVTISYAVFALAFSLGHIVLAKQIWYGPKVKENKFLYAYIYRAMQVGIFLLTVGVILGGVWANYSWGRFWGWDPKETWALIAILCYLFVLHGRLVGWWKGFGMTVGGVVGFMSVLMCWYGVNFILGAGLHSYGFGVGGTGYVVGFVVAELLFVALAIYRRYSGGSGSVKVSRLPEKASAEAAVVKS